MWKALLYVIKFEWNLLLTEKTIQKHHQWDKYIIFEHKENHTLHNDEKVKTLNQVLQE